MHLGTGRRRLTGECRSSAVSGGFRDTVRSVICGRPFRATPQCRAISYRTPVMANRRTERPEDTDAGVKTCRVQGSTKSSNGRTPRPIDPSVNKQIVLVEFRVEFSCRQGHIIR